MLVCLLLFLVIFLIFEGSMFSGFFLFNSRDPFLDSSLTSKFRESHLVPR